METNGSTKQIAKLKAKLEECKDMAEKYGWSIKKKGTKVMFYPPVVPIGIVEQINKTDPIPEQLEEQMMKLQLGAALEKTEVEPEFEAKKRMADSFLTKIRKSIAPKEGDEGHD